MDPEIFMSPLCREISADGTRVDVDIYPGEEESGWILEVVDEKNASTFWDDPFDTDQEALDAVMEVIEHDGIRSFLDGEANPCTDAVIVSPKLTGGSGLARSPGSH